MTSGEACNTSFINEEQLFCSPKKTQTVIARI